MADDQIPGLGPPALRPIANPNVDVTALRLTPVEGFVLSRVDGRTSYREILLMSGLPPRQGEQMLRRFKDQGLILNPGETPSSASAAGAARSVPGAAATARAAPSGPSRERGASVVPPARSPSAVPPVPGDRARQPSPPQGPSLLERLDDRSSVDPAELIGAPDMDTTTKVRLVRLQRRLPRLSAAELLGVSPDADARTVRQAYFQASKELHPDRYYGKNIGPFRERLEQVFRRLSEAFGELTTQRGGKRR